MLNLQDKMIELSDYNIGCKIEDGYYLINITYKDKWKVIPPENEMIECAENNNVTYYCAPVNKVSFEEVFKSINDTIEYNMDLERKVQLFREKVNELQTIFAEEDIDVLKTITFKYKKPKKRNHKVENVNETFDETITETNDVSEDNNLNLMDNDQNENKLTFVEEIER